MDFTSDINWESNRLGDLIKDKRNGIYKKKEYHGRGVKIVNMGELFKYDVISNQEMELIELSQDEKKRFLLKDGDLLFARRSLVLDGSGKCSLVANPKEEITFESSIIRLRLDKEIANPRFYFYYFKSPQGRAKIISIASRTAVSGIRSNDLIELYVDTPPILVQKNIASILSAFDDLIENNTRRIQILEEMALLIYKEWFVHFRYPGHENVPLVDSPLGKIPKGWEVKKLEEVCNLVIGQSPKSEFYNENGDGLPFHQGVKDFGNRYPATTTWCTIKKRVAEEGDILFSVRAPVGRINIANTKMVIGRGLHAIRSKYGYQVFIYHQLKEKFQEEDTIGGGTIFKSVTKSDVQGLKLIIPVTNLINSFEDKVSPIFRHIKVLTNKNIYLKQIRDLLLPKLISGKINVEKIIVK